MAKTGVGPQHRKSARLCTLLANPVRIRLLEALANREQTVGDLTTEAGVSLQNVSQHLRLFRQHGAVKTRKVGRQVYYRLSTPQFTKVVRVLQSAAVAPTSNRKRK